MRLRSDRNLIRLLWLTCFVFLFLLSVPRTAWAQNCGPSVSASEVFYVNGINTDVQSARDSLLQLRNALRPELQANGVRANCVIFSNSFNFTDTILLDLVQSAAQVLAGDLASFWRTLAGLQETPEELEQFALAQAASVDAASYVVANELAMHVSSYLQAISDGRKVILVAHSQGNLYANAAYGVLSDVDVQSSLVDIIAVASPASFVADDGPTGACAATPCYTTLEEDPIWRLPVVPSPLQPNITNGGTCGGIFTFASCHGFTRSYLYGASSGPRIRAHIIEAIVNRLPLAGFTMKQIGFVIQPLEAHEGETLTTTAIFGPVSISFEANRSVDADGMVTSWEWRLNDVVQQGVGDRFTATLGVGEHTISLVVVDDLAARSAQVSGRIVVLSPPPNEVPTAGFTMTSGEQSALSGETLSLNVPPGATAFVDAAAPDCSPGPASGCSYDPDGHIAGRSWTLNGSVRNPLGDTLLLELGAGTHTVTLTVTDDDGAESATASGTITVSTTATHWSTYQHDASRSGRTSDLGSDSADRSVVNRTYEFAECRGWTRR